MVGGSAGDGRIGGGGFYCAKSVNGFRIGEIGGAKLVNGF